MLRRDALPLKHGIILQKRRDRRSASVSMTICIAAFADGGKGNGTAIVCVADKMLSFGQYSQWDSDITKIIHIPPRASTHALVAGSLSHCEGVLNKLSEIEDVDSYHTVLADHLEAVYITQYSHYQEIEVLTRRGVSKAAYEQSLASQSVSAPMQKIADEMEAFVFDCDIMLCGIDSLYSPYIVSISPPGKLAQLSMQGFNSIGIGADIANSRILWADHERTHSWGRVLFDLFDAKANAEMSPGVGFTWDGVIIFSDGAYKVPKHIKELIEQSWSEHNRSPFKKWSSTEDMPRPKSGWKNRILELQKVDLEKSE